MFQKNRTMLLLLQDYHRKPNDTSQEKVTDAELLYQLKKVDAQLEEGQRESEDCEDALYCKSLVPIMKALPLKNID